MSKDASPNPVSVWWSISEAAILEALRRVEAGESADMVYISLYLDSDIEDVPSEGEDE